MKALEILGFGPCHHTETIANESYPYRNSQLWQQACLIDERQARRKILSKLYQEGGFRSGCDYPTALFVDDLVEMYPEAKVLHLSLQKRGSMGNYSIDTHSVRPRRALLSRSLARVCQPDNSVGSWRHFVLRLLSISANASQHGSPSS
jgi:hypothetical protein